VRHEPPLVARARNVSNTVEYRPQIVLVMCAVLTAQQQIRQHKRPLLVRHIARIANPSLVSHPSMLDRKQAHAKTLPRYKLHNRL